MIKKVAVFAVLGAFLGALAASGQLKDASFGKAIFHGKTVDQVRAAVIKTLKDKGFSRISENKDRGLITGELNIEKSSLEGVGQVARNIDQWTPPGKDIHGIQKPTLWTVALKEHGEDVYMMAKFDQGATEPLNKTDKIMAGDFKALVERISKNLDQGAKK